MTVYIPKRPNFHEFFIKDNWEKVGQICTLVWNFKSQSSVLILLVQGNLAGGDDRSIVEPVKPSPAAQANQVAGRAKHFV